MTTTEQAAERAPEPGRPYADATGRELFRSVSARIDYKAIALESVDLLCSLGFIGLHPSRQRELWQRALNLDRRLHPDREPIVVWTEEEGDVDPPRKPGNNRGGPR